MEVYVVKTYDYIWGVYTTKAIAEKAVEVAEWSSMLGGWDRRFSIKETTLLDDIDTTAMDEFKRKGHL